jgi:hypothetical protein
MSDHVASKPPFRELVREPVMEADVVYRSEYDAADKAVIYCWRYYHLESFWNLYTDDEF